MPRPITFDGMGSIIAAQGSQGPRIMVDATWTSSAASYGA
jgi:hypothetical protein